MIRPSASRLIVGKKVHSYLLVIEHENLGGSGQSETRVSSRSALADVDAHGLQQRGQEEREVFRGRVGRGDQDLVVRSHHQVLVELCAERDCGQLLLLF